jgi:hypothetical protein
MSFIQIGTKAQLFQNVQDCTRLPLQQTIRLISGCEYFVGIVSGPMHIATALGIRCIIVLNFPHAHEIFLPVLKDIDLVESEWLYPQNVHLHQDGEGPLVPRLSYENLERAFNGEIHPYWSQELLP